MGGWVCSGPVGRIGDGGHGKVDLFCAARVEDSGAGGSGGAGGFDVVDQEDGSAADFAPRAGAERESVADVAGAGGVGDFRLRAGAADSSQCGGDFLALL